ncbi:serotriflin-like [Mantella aurantiaca]
MLPLIFMCFMKLLEHPVVLGDPGKTIYNQDTDKAKLSYSESGPFEFPDSVVGYLPSGEEEFSNAKHKKTVRKRETKGRNVNLPPDAVKSLMDKPISYFSPTTEVNQKMILDTHNKYRSNADPTAANMLKLIWNDEAAKSAQAWADKCVQGHSPAATRKITNMKCGENIFLAAYKMTWDIVTDCWHSEDVDFKYGVGSTNGAEVGHYTQLMWGTSSNVGCGLAVCPNLANTYNYVCHYCPLGNLKPTAYPYKSGKPCEDCPNACENGLCKNPCPHMNYFVNCKGFMTGNTCGNDQSLIDDCPAMCKCTNGEIY